MNFYNFYNFFPFRLCVFSSSGYLLSVVLRASQGASQEPFAAKPSSCERGSVRAGAIRQFKTGGELNFGDSILYDIQSQLFRRPRKCAILSTAPQTAKRPRSRSMQAPLQHSGRIRTPDRFRCDLLPPSSSLNNLYKTSNNVIIVWQLNRRLIRSARTASAEVSAT